MSNYRRVLNFLSLTARDVLLPDVIGIPLAVACNFYTCFLCVSPAEKMELLREARTLSDAELEQLVDAFADGWRALLPGGQLTQNQRAALRQLIGVLREGANASGNANAAVNQSLSRVIGTGNAIPEPAQPADQVAVGRTLLLAALRKQSTGGPRPLPANPPTIPGYELCSVLGDGGFSVVYLARHLASGELRAVKVGRIVSQTRFRSEIRAITTLSGPHVVRYHEHGEMGDQFWIAMDYLGEHTLADLIASRPDAEQALLVAAQLLRGLVALHRAGIIHRDLKPENAMVDTSFNLRLIDFGLSRAEETAVGVSATRTTGIVGTPRYNSPEQINEEGITTATDLWAFGCVLYELFTGTPLFAETRIIRLFDQIRNDPLPNLENSPIPPEIRPFLLRCLERDPAKRWPHAEQAERAFQEAMQPARRRLRHERYQPSWEKIFQTGLLERFAEKHVALSPEQRLPRLVEMVRNEGIEAIDEERLGEILPPLYETQAEVVKAFEELHQAKQRLACEVPSLTGEDIRGRTRQIEKLEKVIENQRSRVRARIAELLDTERQSWEERLHRAELARKQEQEAFIQKQREEAARIERIQQEQARQARLDRIRTEEEEEIRRNNSLLRLWDFLTKTTSGMVLIIIVGVLFALLVISQVGISSGSLEKFK